MCIQLNHQNKFCIVNFLQYSFTNLTSTPVIEAAFCSYNLDVSLSLIKAFIFAQALKSELYFDDSFKLVEIENKK